MVVRKLPTSSTTKLKVVRPADMFLLGFSATLVLIFLNAVEIHSFTTTTTSTSSSSFRAVGVVGNIPLSLLSLKPSSKTATSTYRTQYTRLFLSDGRPTFPTSSPGGTGPPSFGGPPGGRPGGPPGFGNSNNGSMSGTQQGGVGPPGFGTGTSNSGGGFGNGSDANTMNGSGQRGGGPPRGGGGSPFIAGPAGGNGSSFGGQTQSAGGNGSSFGSTNNFGAPKGGQNSGGFGASKSAGSFPGKSSAPGFSGGPPGKAASAPGFGGGQGSGGLGAPKSAGGFPGKSSAPGFGGGPPGKAASVPGLGGGQASGGFGAPKSTGLGGGQSSGGFGAPKSTGMGGGQSSGGFGAPKSTGIGGGQSSGFGGGPPGKSSFGAGPASKGGFGAPTSSSAPGMRGGPRGGTGSGSFGGPPSASSSGFGPGAGTKKVGGGFGNASSSASSPSFGAGPGGAKGSGNGFGAPGMSTGPRDGGGFASNNGPGISKGMSNGPGRGGIGPVSSSTRGGGGGFGSNNGPGTSNGMNKGPGRGLRMGSSASDSRGGGGGFGPGMSQGQMSSPGMSMEPGRGGGMGPGNSMSRSGGVLGSNSRTDSRNDSRIGVGRRSTPSFEGANGSTSTRSGVRGGSSTFNGGGPARPGVGSSGRSNKISTGQDGPSSFESRSSSSPFSRDSSPSFGSSATRDSSRNGFSPSSGSRPGRGDQPDAIPGMDLGQRNSRGFGDSRMRNQGGKSPSPFGRGPDSDIGTSRPGSGFSRSDDRDNDRMSSTYEVGGRLGISGERGMNGDRSFGRDQRSSFSRDRNSVGFASDSSRRNEGFIDRKHPDNNRFQDRDDDFMGRRQDSDFTGRGIDRMDDYEGGGRVGDPWNDRDRRRGRDLSSPASSLILFGHPDSRSPIIQWAAYELGLGELESGNLADNPHPFGKIPCLIDETMVSSTRRSRDRYDDDDEDDDDEICIFESGAILQYLHDRFYASSNDNDDRSRGSASSRRRRLSPKLSAALSSWILWANASLEPICFLTNPADGSTIEGTGLHQRRLSGNPIVEMDKLDDYLSEKSKNSRDSGPQYLLGRGHDAFTVADIAVSSYLLFALRFYPDLDLSTWPFVVRFMEDCAGRPSYGRSFGRDVQDRLLLLLRNMSTRGKSRDMLRLPSSSSSKRGRLPSGLTLYGHPSSPENPMIEWAVYELDLKDYLRDGDLRRNPNPLGKVPTLTDQNGKIMVFQVGSILQYFQETYGSRIDGGKIIEDDDDVVAQDGAEINSWIVFANTDLESFVKPDRLGVEDLRSGKPDGAMSPYGGQNQQSGRLVRAGDSRVQMSQQNLEGLDRLDDLLSKKQRDNYERYGGSRKPVYLVGDSFSLADVAVASYLLYLPQSSPVVDLNRWKALKEYMIDCASRDGYGYAFGRKTQAFVLGELESNHSGRLQSTQRPSNNNYRSASPNGATYNEGPRGTRIFANGVTPSRQGQGRSQDDTRGLFRPVV